MKKLVIVLAIITAILVMNKEEEIENHVTLPHKFILRDSTKDA